MKVKLNSKVIESTRYDTLNTGDTFVWLNDSMPRYFNLCIAIDDNIFLGYHSNKWLVYLVDHYFKFSVQKISTTLVVDE